MIWRVESVLGDDITVPALGLVIFLYYISSDYNFSYQFILFVNYGLFLFLYPNMGDFPKYVFAIMVCFFVSFVYRVFSFLCVKIIRIGGSKFR